MAYEFTQSLTLEEARVCRAEIYKALGRKRDMVIVMIMGVIASVGMMWAFVDWLPRILITYVDPFLGATLMIASVLVGQAFRQGLVWWDQQDFKNFPMRWSEDWSMRFGSDQINVQNGFGENTISWEALSGWIAAPAGILFIFATEALCVPKVCFRDSDEMVSFIEFVRTKAPTDAAEINRLRPL